MPVSAFRTDAMRSDRKDFASDVYPKAEPVSLPPGSVRFFISLYGVFCRVRSEMHFCSFSFRTP